MTIGAAAVLPLVRRAGDLLPSFVRRPAFQAAFYHGLWVIAGGALGLMVWLYLLRPLGPQPVPVPHAPAPPHAVVATAPIPAADHHPAPTAAPDTHHTEPATSPEAAPHSSASPLTEAAPQTPDKVTPPLPGLIEHDATYGDLPVVRKQDGLRPFDAYRRPTPADQLNKPLLALAMLDYGLSPEASGSIMGVMPPEVSVVFSPAVHEVAHWAEQAFNHGHETWLELAVEPPDYPESDPGARALLSGASIEANHAALMGQLGMAVGYTGLIATHDSPLFSTATAADFIAKNLFDRGLGLMLNAAQVNATMTEEAAEYKSPFYAGSMIILDDLAGPAEIARRMADAEAQAKAHGYAIVLFRPSASARAAVVSWLATFANKGLAPAPLSIIAERGLELKE